MSASILYHGFGIRGYQYERTFYEEGLVTFVISQARDRLRCDPLSGHVFLFANAQRNRVKLLFWDGSGLWVCAKRLEKGRFRWPETTGEETKVVLSHEELALLLGGIDLADTQRRQWYRREVTPVIDTQIFA